MADELRPDIAAAAAKLNSTFGSKREIRKLVDHLWEGEQVEQLTTGQYGPGLGLLARTDRRLLFLKDGWGGGTSEDFPFSKISSVQWSSSVLTGTITIFASGNKAEIKNVQKDSGKSLVDALRAIIADPPAHAAHPATAPAAIAPAGAQGGDIIEQIRKLGDLRAAGILTDAEFEAKKADLLSRL